MCTLESGRTFVLSMPTNDSIEAAYEAFEEAALMDDYLTDLIKL
tara:strand:- start:2844 stop:2975 length:132 start_codon:yes stop_codon:yes gene_type:complete